MKEKGTPIYGSPSSNKARAAASRVRWPQSMRLLYFILLITLYSCSFNERQDSALLQKQKIRFADSFSLQGYKAEIKELENNKGDSFRIICEWKGQEIMSYLHETPSAFIKAQNIYGSQDKEIMIDECVACEGFESLRVFYFDTNKSRFIKIRGMDSISSEIFLLPESEVFYDSYIHNNGEEQSTLFRLVGDSCMRLAKLVVPYKNGKIILISFLAGKGNREVSFTRKEKGDSTLALFWKTVSREF